MEEHNNSFRDIPQRIAAGDDEAAEIVFSHFTARLVALARSRLESRMQPKFDAEDVVQSVYRSFFLRQQNDHFEFESWEGVWALLARITVRKCGRRVKHYRAAKRDTRRETNAPLDVSEVRGATDEVVSRDPTAEEAVVFEETLQSLMSQLDEQQQEILSHRLQGYTIVEISSRLGVTERSIYRLMARVRTQLTEIESSCALPIDVPETSSR